VRPSDPVAGPRSLQVRLGIALGAALIAWLALAALDQTPLWDDEAQVGIFARNLLETGHLSAWDGRNFYGYRNGSILYPTTLDINQPPLMFWVAAGSFAVLGDTTWAARLPFALFGLLALGLFAAEARRAFPGGVWVYASASMGLSVTFLLNIRQCRYYAAALLFIVLVHRAHRACLRRGRWGDFALLALAATLLF
jgi:4-amino-4-deoxy-L-arabinose transferase-like glycosyltransferase